MRQVKPLTISEVSRVTGISRGTVYRALRHGRLAKFEVLTGTRRLLRPGVVEYLRSGAIRPRADSPWVARAPEPAAEPAGAVDLLPDGWPAAGDAAVADNSDLLPECWDDERAGWQEFSETWGGWRPDEQLGTAEYWEHVAALMRAWMADPLPPITASTAPSWYMAAADATAAVSAGFRWDAAVWAARSAEMDQEFGITEPDT
jgi:excisionase family DNA binding protein